MSFFVQTEENESENISAQEMMQNDILALVRAKGFDFGPENQSYEFHPNNYRTQQEGSIINGKVTGTCTPKRETIIFNRKDFSESSWKKICKCMGFKYYNYELITKFRVDVEKLTVSVCIPTPTDES